MNILLIGSGGREHALAWRIAQSPLVDKLYCAPGNPGMARCAECVDIKASDLRGLLDFAESRSIDLTVVGPEDPLANGLVDRFARAGLKAFGPSGAAAQLEASKTFAKQLMRVANIPTATYAEFDDARLAIEYIESHNCPLVVKADGLAAGKGVTVAPDAATAIQAVREAMIDKMFGDAGSKVIIEECLIGEEASILAFSDGKTVVPMLSSQDHKPVFDDDQGPNTGGMGAYSPAPVVTPEMLREVQATILQPCVDEMANAGTPYVGVLYAGLMITANGPKVIEFNCRFGDPETQVVLPQMKTDLVPVMLACCEGSLADMPIEWADGACVTVVMASGGYPREYEKGKAITGIDDAEREAGITVFHAGTKRADAGIVTSGGRVLNVTATGPGIPGTIEKAYRAVSKIHFAGAHYRTDIGKKALARLR